MPPVRVVLCPDKFRGSASAAEVAAALAEGIGRVRPDVEITERPVADGGEGTVDALVAAGWTRHTAEVRGPVGEPVRAPFAMRDGHAVVELAQASGSGLLDEPAPLIATTYGTGQLVAAALDAGASAVTIAVGGSASTDGGAGLLIALGAHVLDDDGRPVSPGGGGLARVAAVDLSRLDPRLTDTAITVATDVDNPLLGERGAAPVFGPQKGATVDDVASLDRALARWADALTLATGGPDHRDDPGAGAAGGTAFAALAALHARRVSGVEFLLGELGVPAAIAGADLVVVGEGRLDDQSLAGKAPIGVAELAREHGVPVVAVAGQVAVDAARLRAHGIVRAYALLDRAADARDAMARTHELLTDVGADIASHSFPSS